MASFHQGDNVLAAKIIMVFLELRVELLIVCSDFVPSEVGKKILSARCNN